MLQSVSLLALVSWGVQILWIPMIMFRQHEMKTDLFWVQIASEVFQGVSGLSDLSSLVCRLVSLGRNDSPFCRSRWTQVTKMIRPPGLHTRCISDINLGPMIAHDRPWLPMIALCYVKNHAKSQGCILQRNNCQDVYYVYWWLLVHAKSSCMVDMQSMQSVLEVCAKGLWFLWHVFAAFQRPDQIEGVVSKGHPLSRAKNTTAIPFTCSVL